MKMTFVFPGQGSQHIGMGYEFYQNFSAAKQVFEEVDDTLGQKLSSLIFEGNLDELTLTHNTQPALMAVSMAIVRTVEKELGQKLTDMSALMAGHSLGEYTAYCAAGTFNIADTATLLRIRGNAMQAAVPVGEGAMAVIMGPTFEEIDQMTKEAAQHQVCVIANDNSPGQIVVSGHKEAIDRVMEIARTAGAKRVLPLNVSAPFHSPLMAPAAEAMEEALSQVVHHNPGTPVIANVTAEPVDDSEDAKSLLVSQVTGRVRWRESILSLKEAGITHVIEIGAGKVLTGLTKRISPELATASVSTPEDMKNLLSLLNESQNLR